ncbi:MAG: hypothetical protein R2747_07515 [Pyrinomonadaceae bacterium]
MKKNEPNAEEYAQLIIEDNLNRIVFDETITHQENYIQINYKFDDGAVVCYEWQDFPFSQTPKTEIFNHKFTLVTPPSPNPENFQPGVIKIIDFPRR